MSDDNVKTTLLSSDTVETLTYALDGAPETVRRHSARVFRPDLLAIEIADGKITHLTISGPRLLARGGEGERLTNTYYGMPLDVPAWLRTVAEQILYLDGAST
jgi:hypothetical protein